MADRYEGRRGEYEERYGSRGRGSRRPEWSERQRGYGGRGDEGTEYGQGPRHRADEEEESGGHREWDEGRERRAFAGRRGYRERGGYGAAGWGDEESGMDYEEVEFGGSRFEDPSGAGFGSRYGEDRYERGYPNYASGSGGYGYGYDQDAGRRGSASYRSQSRYGSGPQGHGSVSGQRGDSRYYGSEEPWGRGGAGLRGGEERWGQHRGRGPKGYTRSDERLKEIICERLTEDPEIDPGEVSVDVKNHEVTLSGTVADRRTKHAIENVVDECGGVTEIHNQLRVRRSSEGEESGRQGSQASSERSRSEKGSRSSQS